MYDNTKLALMPILPILCVCENLELQTQLCGDGGGEW